MKWEVLEPRYKSMGYSSAELFACALVDHIALGTDAYGRSILGGRKKVVVEFEERKLDASLLTAGRLLAEVCDEHAISIWGSYMHAFRAPVMRDPKSAEGALLSVLDVVRR